MSTNKSNPTPQHYICCVCHGLGNAHCSGCKELCMTNNPTPLGDKELRKQFELAVMEGIIGDSPIGYNESGRRKADKVIRSVDALLKSQQEQLLDAFENIVSDDRVPNPTALRGQIWADAQNSLLAEQRRKLAELRVGMGGKK